MQGPLAQGIAELPWTEIGPPPPAVEQARLVRLKKFVPWFSTFGGVMMGGASGFAALAIWPGAFTWPFTQRVELFLAVALIVGVAEVFFFRWIIPWVVRASTLRVRRISVSDGKIHVEHEGGAPFSVPLKHVWVDPAAVAEDWRSVSVGGGRSTVNFYVPGTVATTISSLLPKRG
jgi:hypothetical protein